MGERATRSDAWLVGAGASPGERALIYAGGLLGAALVWALFLRPDDVANRSAL